MAANPGLFATLASTIGVSAARLDTVAVNLARQASTVKNGIKDEAMVWEHSVELPGYNAVLSLLVMREPIQDWDDCVPAEQELDPIKFMLNRKQWPSER